MTESMRVGLEVVDLPAIATGGAYGRPVWSGESEDFNLNLAVLPGGQSVDEHTNGEVDVLVLGVSGSGTVSVNERSVPVGVGQLVVIPKGTRRSIGSGEQGFGYLLCHRRRRGLWPDPLPQKSSESSVTELT